MFTFIPEALDDACHKAKIGEPDWLPRPAPFKTTPWIAVSVLQKAIRRAEEGLALRAASTLFELDPKRFWRRLGIIAFEDVGIGGVGHLQIVLPALGGKRVRAMAGGEWAVAARLVLLLARSNKCRAVDDLWMVAGHLPAYAKLRLKLASGSAEDVTEIFKTASSLEIKAVALYSLHEAIWEGLGHSKGKDIALAFDLLEQDGCPRDVLELCRLGYKRTREPLALIYPLILMCPPLKVEVLDDQFPAQEFKDGIPLWAVDKHTRQGKAAYAKFLETDTLTSLWIKENVPARSRLEVLGRLVFAAESGQMRHRLNWPFAEHLRYQWQRHCLSFQCPDGAEPLATLPGEIPLLNELRGKCL